MRTIFTKLARGDMGMHTCSVCSYSGLHAAPADYLICPCCGTEFGYHDFNASHTALRENWVANGAKWVSKVVPPPEGWSARRQLNNGLPAMDLVVVRYQSGFGNGASVFSPATSPAPEHREWPSRVRRRRMPFLPQPSRAGFGQVAFG